MKKSINIRIKGLVQGVGFRPFVYRIAGKHGLKGRVENRNDGVIIDVVGEENALNSFIEDLKTNTPPASEIHSVEIQNSNNTTFTDFQISKSKNISEEITLVSPDISVCKECLEDMKIQEHRIDYPFINCTNCGPRFTIIRSLPYDRPETTMSVFPMCEKCSSEYCNVLDRRFHAQPVACSNCGPKYSLNFNGKKIEDQNLILKTMRTLLKEGKVIAVKGMGGYFLACDALNQEAVRKLREGKNREGKPFAVMFPDMETIEKYAYIDEDEKRWISSWQRPIILLRKKKALARDVCVGFSTIGSMLPYMPFHYLLFEGNQFDALVFTSGNIIDEPIVIDDNRAIQLFLPIYDAVLTYNREIFNRVDDSVGMIVNHSERIIRRSRGYAPSPIHLDLDVDGLIAVGAELVNSFCVGKGKQAFLSQHIGDLKNLETYEFFRESMSRFTNLFRVQPQLMVCDLHPDYLSSKFAAQAGLPVMEVQHHHAHIASCMAEYKLDEKVIGVAFDGVGLGDDGRIWGGEFFICDLKEYRRLNHFEYVMMPGGDQATLHPWRMAVSYLYHTFGTDFLDMDLPFLKSVDKKELELVIQMLEKKINSPLSSSAGRLFDAVAALTGLCNHSSFHAEAPMRLETMIKDASGERYDFINNGSISFVPMIKKILKDIHHGISVEEISAKFHNTIIEMILEVCNQLRAEENVRKVVLSGGSFQNRYILERLERKLLADGFEVFAHKKLPSNDGGIALGQIAIAAKRRAIGGDMIENEAL
ncbi:MAG: carbamoyltransferase HypF [Bacteroidota bacterium]|nr:carbamoyltransferase HypF [Bacteroidota bacterium]